MIVLESTNVKMFRSIDDSDPVVIDRDTTVLVGQNESGKTAFLQALYKTRPIDKDGFDVTRDYPRKKLNEYERRHATNPDTVVENTYIANTTTTDAINNALDMDLFEEIRFTLSEKYDNDFTVSFDVIKEEAALTQKLVSQASLPMELTDEISQISTLKELVIFLQRSDLNDTGKAFLSDIVGRFKYDEGVKNGWDSLLAYYIWSSHLKSVIPKFLYFDDYYLLPGKINLSGLQTRVTQSTTSKTSLEIEDRTVLSLLHMAGVDLNELLKPTGYERNKARLEGLSNTITDEIFNYWHQNSELTVEFDIDNDPLDQPPFNAGPNLYIRIKNPRHRVSVPFSQRSKGFIWFFSFIVWFNNIQETNPNQTLILLLDEPGLSLHALAQADLLAYIDKLAESHQVIYTTHSPFMVHSDRLHQVRVVEDRDKVGTKVSDNLSGGNAKTIFPLQAALGYTLAQNLFISKRNLLVEGPGDLVYLTFFSNALETLGRTGLRSDVTIMPVGGLDKLATFVALLAGNDLELVVLHDYESKPDQRLEALKRERLLREKQILHYALYRNTSPLTSAPKGKSPASTLTELVSTDVEDMLDPSIYLTLFNQTFAAQLGDQSIEEIDLGPGDRIVLRIERLMAQRGIQLKPSGGFNHYTVANHLASNPVLAENIEPLTLSRFERLFNAVNRLYSATDEDL